MAAQYGSRKVTPGAGRFTWEKEEQARGVVPGQGSPFSPYLRLGRLLGEPGMDRCDTSLSLEVPLRARGVNRYPGRRAHFRQVGIPFRPQLRVPRTDVFLRNSR